MPVKENLRRIVYENLPFRRAIDPQSPAIDRAAEILVGISGDLVAEASKARVGLQATDEALSTMRQKYSKALQTARGWAHSSSPGDDEVVAYALVEHLETTGRKYGFS